MARAKRGGTAPKRDGYRRIDQWERTKDGRDFTIWIYTKTDKEVAAHGGEHGLLATCDDPDCKFSLYDTDITSLKEAVDKEIAKSTGLQWAPKIYVIARGGHEAGDFLTTEGGQLEIVYGFVDVTERGGQQVYRRRGSQDFYNKQLKTGDFFRGFSLSGKKTDSTAALIDDTPENRQALETLTGRLGELAERVREFMAPDKIIQTLSGGGLLLAAPATEEEDD